MASLTGASVASSYTSLLKLNGNTDSLVAGNGSNGIQIVDGDGTGSPLYLNTDRLGVGVSPSAPLHIYSTINNTFSDTIDADDYSGDTLVVENKPASSNDDYVSIAMATSGSQYISSRIVLDNDGSGNGALKFQMRSSGDLDNTTTRMTLTDDGQLVIGATTAQQKFEVHGGGIRINGNIATPSSGVSGALIDYFGSDTRFWSRGADASTVGSFKFIGLENDGGNQSTQLEIDSAGVVNLPNGQLQFPASQNASSDANTLDDYEEGEHTTTITGATSGSWVLDSAQNKLSYTKIGRLVTVIGKFETDSGSGAGTLKISMPFTAANLTSGAGIAAGSITINRYGSTSIATQITPIIFEGNNFINVQIHSTDGTSNESYVQADDIDAIFEGQLSITYFTD